jgi:hypothetical protein
MLAQFCQWNWGGGGVGAGDIYPQTSPVIDICGLLLEKEGQGKAQYS